MSKKKKNLPEKRFLFEEVLSYLKKNSGKAFNYKQISAALDLEHSEKFKVIDVLEALKKEKLVVEAERGKYLLKGGKRLLEGLVDFTSSGDAYVAYSETENDIFIHHSKTGLALQGDTVKFTLREGFGRKKEGEIVEVVKRNKTDFVGIVQSTPRHCFVIPNHNKIHVDFYIPPDKTTKAENGQKVLIRLLDWKKEDKNPSAEIIQVFGFPGEHNTEIHAIMAEYGLPSEFPENVEKAAHLLNTAINPNEIARRRDFRNTLTFTIDPHDAKDFDDALSLSTLSNEIGRAHV